MARPTTKSVLIEAATEKYTVLMNLINNMSELENSTLFDFSNQPSKKESHWARDNNVRDILVHLHNWHLLLIKWFERNSNSNDVIPFLPKEYTWKTIADLNQVFFDENQSTSLDKSIDLFNSSHNKVLEIIKSFNDEELFTKKYFNYTGSTSLGSYCVSATSSHYDWAIKKIKAHKKNCK